MSRAESGWNLVKATMLLFETFHIFILLSGFQVPLFCLIHFPMMDFLRDPEIPVGTLDLTKHVLGSQVCARFKNVPVRAVLAPVRINGCIETMDGNGIKGVI